MLTAEGLSATGDAIFWVGLLVWLLDHPDGAFLIAMAAVARLAPRVVFGPAGGVIADRYDRRALVVGLDLVRSLLMVVLAFSVDADSGAAPTPFTRNTRRPSVHTRAGAVLVSHRADVQHPAVRYGSLPRRPNVRTRSRS